MPNLWPFLLVVLCLCACARPTESGGDPPIVIDTDAGSHTDGAAATACGTHNCEGCCDADDRCRLGLDDHECGSGGALCGDCTDEGGWCVEAVCSPAGCGDGRLGDDELCEGTALHGETCETLGFLGGLLACSDDCQFDRSACESLTCANVVEERDACDFCQPDGSIMRCGFCRDAPDEVEACPAGESCYSWRGPISNHAETVCRPEPPTICQVGFEPFCDGEVAVYCGFADEQFRRDCPAEDPGTECREYVTPGGAVAGCIETDAVPCNPSAVGAGVCDGDELVVCDEFRPFETRYPCVECIEFQGQTECLSEPIDPCDPETHVVTCAPEAYIVCQPLFPDIPGSPGKIVMQPCTAGWTCEDAASGPQCVAPGTTACDPATYVRHCDGTNIRSCGFNQQWELLQDCADQPGFGCMEFEGAPTCIQEPFQACTWPSDATCTNGTGQTCNYPGWSWTYAACSGLNNTCVTAGAVATCTFPGGVACTPSPDFGDEVLSSAVGPDGLPIAYTPLRCDGARIIGCDVTRRFEVLLDCDVGTCVADPQSGLVECQ